jgi:hypothetical protein
MSPTVIKLLVRAAIFVLKRYYANLTKEQMVEIKEATKENFEHAGNMGTGVGE